MRNAAKFDMANPQTKVLDVTGFGSSRFLLTRGGLPSDDLDPHEI